MTQLKKPSFWFIVFLVLVALSFVVQSFAYKPDARLFPLVIGIPTAITGILIVLAEKWPGLIKRFDVTVGAKVKKVAPGIEAGDEAPKEQVEPISEAQSNKRVLTLGAWMAGYMGVILLAGFTVANFLLLIEKCWLLLLQHQPAIEELVRFFYRSLSLMISQYTSTSEFTFNAYTNCCIASSCFACSLATASCATFSCRSSRFISFILSSTYFLYMISSYSFSVITSPSL